VLDHLRKKQTAEFTRDDLKAEINQLVLDWNQCFSGCDRRQRRLHGQHSVFAERALDLLGVRSFGQEEFPIVLSIHRLGLCLFLVFGVHQ
jgi:hypothetical protein